MLKTKTSKVEPPSTPSMDLEALKKSIEVAGNEYAKRHMRQPTAIKLRKDVDTALHGSTHAFLFDFVDMTMSRERFMGMDVTIAEDGPEFSIEDLKEVNE